MAEAKFQREQDLDRLKEESGWVRRCEKGPFFPSTDLAAGSRKTMLGSGQRAWTASAKTAGSFDMGVKGVVCVVDCK